MNYNSIAGGGYAITLSTSQGERPKETPPGLINTRAVETKAGWLGQIIVDKEIMYETDVHDYSERALAECNRRVVAAIKGLFARVIEIEAAPHDD